MEKYITWVAWKVGCSAAWKAQKLVALMAASTAENLACLSAANLAEHLVVMKVDGTACDWVDMMDETMVAKKVAWTDIYSAALSAVVMDIPRAASMDWNQAVQKVALSAASLVGMLDDNLAECWDDSLVGLMAYPTTSIRRKVCKNI